jgi:hypothetical protein
MREKSFLPGCAAARPEPGAAALSEVTPAALQAVAGGFRWDTFAAMGVVRPGDAVALNPQPLPPMPAPFFSALFLRFAFA